MNLYRGILGISCHIVGCYRWIVYRCNCYGYSCRMTGLGRTHIAHLVRKAIFACIICIRRIGNRAIWILNNRSVTGLGKRYCGITWHICIIRQNVYCYWHIFINRCRIVGNFKNSTTQYRGICRCTVKRSIVGIYCIGCRAAIGWRL